MALLRTRVASEMSLIDWSLLPMVYLYYIENFPEVWCISKVVSIGYANRSGLASINLEG
jgi:hypothetical protein